MLSTLDADGNPQLVLDPDGLVAAVQHSSAAKLDTQPPKRPVLVVDDSLTTRMLEQSILESAGYDVDRRGVRRGGARTSSRRNTTRCSSSMSKCRAWMASPSSSAFGPTRGSRDIPAILVTSRAEPEHRQRGRDVGAQGYIVKSEFDQADLLSMIKPLVA